jgi:hypothetical protein
MICYTSQILLGDVIMEKKMVAVFSTHGRVERYIEFLLCFADRASQNNLSN